MKLILKKLRMWILLSFFYKIKSVEKGFYMGRNNIINCPNLVIGSFVYLGNNCHLSVESLTIEDYVMLASQVSIVGGDHKFDVVGTPIRYTGRGERKGVIIKRDSWIGHGVTILDGVTIGEGCIIAAGTIVTKSTEPYSVHAGVPNRKIRNRFEKLDDVEIHSKMLNNYEANNSIL